MDKSSKSFFLGSRGERERERAQHAQRKMCRLSVVKCFLFLSRRERFFLKTVCSPFFFQTSSFRVYDINPKSDTPFFDLSFEEKRSASTSDVFFLVFTVHKCVA